MRLRPPYNPQKSKNKRFKKYKTNTTEEEKADSLRRKQKQTACSASRKESKKYKKEKIPRKENASLSLRRKIKAKNRECKNHWERKYISPGARRKEFPLVNLFLFCHRNGPLSFLNVSIRNPRSLFSLPPRED